MEGMPCICTIGLWLIGVILSGLILYGYYLYLRFLRREENYCPCLLMATLVHPFIVFVAIPHDTFGWALASLLVPATLYAVIAIATWIKIKWPPTYTIPARTGYCGEPDKPAETRTTTVTVIDWVQAILATIGAGIFIALVFNIESVLPM